MAEIQFADYIFPAFDQIANEAAKCVPATRPPAVNCRLPRILPASRRTAH
jgi:pyruvate/2-oxoglutarate/acetoin dehydrogenase E1 component